MPCLELGLARAYDWRQGCVQLREAKPMHAAASRAVSRAIVVVGNNSVHVRLVELPPSRMAVVA